MTDISSFPQHKLLFVGGLHRSGTTVVCRLLGSNREVSIFKNTGAKKDEGQFLQNALPVDGAFGGPGLFGFDSRAHMTERDLGSEDTAEELLKSWAPFWDRTRNVLVEKSPINILRARFLQALFPESRFVFVIRHPVAVSMATSKWCGSYMSSLIEHWCMVHEMLWADRQFINESMIINYEELVNGSEQYLDQLAKFVGVSGGFSSKVVMENRNTPYYAMWRKGQFHLKEQFPWWKKKAKKWRNNWEFRKIEEVYEHRIERFGYSFRDVYI